MAGMLDTEVAATRLRSQRIEGPGCATPLEVVETLGALQGQDYNGVLWSIGLRMPGSTVAGIERAFDEAQIVRTWPMRGTLHVIPAADARWMLELLTPRVVRRTARRREQLGLDEATLDRAAKVFSAALIGGNRLTRADLLGRLEAEHISIEGGRGYHILFHLSMHQLICFGPSQGKQQTFVLFDEWLSGAKSRDRDESLALLARRYFGGHGPATIDDFVWWSGLTVADARAGIEANADSLVTEEIGRRYWMRRAEVMEPARSRVSLLPGFDEYLLGYKDRGAVLRAEYSQRIAPGGNGVFRRTLVVGGQVTGVWRRTNRRGETTLEVIPFRRLSSTEQRDIEVAERRYGAFLGRP